MSDKNSKDLPEKAQSQPGVPDDNPDTPGGVIDPQVKEEVSQNVPEDPFFTEYGKASGSSDNEKVDVTSDWIGDESGNNWKPKTIISADQIIALSQVRMLPKAFPELEGIEDLLLEQVQAIEQYAVSRDGISREQQVEVLKAMNSGEDMPHDDAGRAIASMFANPPDNDDE